jgi:hypothetical protein
MATTTTQTTRAASGPTHPVYDTWRHVWEQLAHVAEGSGGFLDGTYLIAHPREWQDHDKPSPSVPTKKLLERRTLARYENLADLVLRQKLAGLFREPPLRRCLNDAGEVIESHPYLDWTENVDGMGTPLTDWLLSNFRAALIYGHQVLVMDRAGDDGLTQADRAALVLRAFTPLDVPDWLQAPSGHLTAVKLQEPILRVSLSDTAARDGLAYRLTEVTAETARSYTTTEPSAVVEVAHKFGTLPVIVLYAHRRATVPLIGLSGLSDPMLYIDLYNLTSEQRELLRKQTFSVTNVQLGTRADGGIAVSVEEAQTMLGSVNSTSNVLFTPGAASMLTADTGNVEVYQATIDALVRMIFRLCAIPYDAESRDAESAEAKRLKRQDYTTALSGYADELTRAEEQIAALWFRGTYGESWETQYAAAGLQVQYPSSFDEPSAEELLSLATAAQSTTLGESKTFRIEHATKMIPAFIPDATVAVQGLIRAELEAMPSPDEQRQARMGALAVRLSTGPARVPDDAEDEDVAPEDA